MMKMGSKLAFVAALTVVVSGVQADPNVIGIFADLSGGIAPNEFSDSIVNDQGSNDHKFGANETFESVSFPGLGFEVDVSSGASGLAGFDWRVTMDFNDFSTVDFDPGTIVYSLEGIKRPGTDLPIGDVALRDGFGAIMPGDVVFDAGNITIEGSIADLIAGDDIISIYWSQAPVPEPMTLGLLAMGGATLLRRRRR